MASKRMESPLVPVILYKIGSMRRHYQPSDEHDVAQNDERLQRQRRPQAPSDSSRVRQADPPAGASPASIAPTMHAAKKRRTSDASSAQSYPFQKSKSFEERNEERSAFISLPKTTDEKDAAASNQEEEKKRPSQDPEEAGGPIMPQPVASMPMASTIPTASAASSAQPHLSPMRYYHQQRYAESIRAKPDAPTFPYQYRGGAAHPTQPDPYGYGYPAGYYHPPQYPRPDPRPDPPSARGHPQFPYFQGYNYQHPHQNPNNMMPSAAAAAAYSQQHRPFVDEYYRAPGSTPPRTYAKKDPPESAKVTEEAKGGGGGGEGVFDLSPTLPSPPVEEDERKPSARRSSSSIQEPSSRDHVNAELHDLYAPLPFNEVRSLLTSSMKTPSPPSPSIQFAKSAASHLDPFSTTPERTHARAAQLPQPSPVVSTAKKRRRGRHPEHAAIGQSHSAGSTASVASTSTSRRENITDSASRRGNSWDRRYNELLEFKQLHGHCDVPQNYAPNPSLGIWVNKQRMEHKNRFDGKSSALNDGRLARLQSIGFRWAKRKGQASWEEKFKELKEYKAEYGNCHVPTKYKENTALGRWVSTQRSEYKKFCEGDTKSAMNADKIRRLESIGFAWFMVL